MKQRLLFILLCAGILSFGNMALSQGQIDTTEIIQGSQTSGYYPIRGYYAYSYAQSIYLASDMNPTVQGQPSVIDKIAYYNVTGNVTSDDQWTIVMGNTNKTSFTGADDWVTSSIDTVFQGTVSVDPNTNWVVIELDEPFVYDGVSNLAIGVLENSSGYNDIDWGVVSTSDERSHCVYSDYTEPSITSPGYGYSYDAVVPKIKIEHVIRKCEDVTFATSYPISITNDTVCKNEEVFASFDSLKTIQGLTFQWQYDNSGTWVNFPGDTGRSLSGILPFTTEIRMKVTCAANQNTFVSADSTIEVEAIPNVQVNFHDVGYCDGNSIAIIASGASNYVWSPSTGLSNSSSNIVNANPTSPTRYVVEGTSTNGCKNTDTVLVTPVSNISSNLVFNSNNLCSSPVTINPSIDDLPSELPGGANWEYMVLASDSSVISNWTSSNNFTFNAAFDSVYGVYIAVRSSGCPTLVDTSSIQTITVGFGASTTVTDYNCNNLGGSIAIANDFGQTSSMVIFSNSFNDENNLTDVEVNGDAGIANGRMVLTPSATSQQGWINITPSGQISSPGNNINIQFDLSIDELLPGYGLAGADGFAYSFGPDAGNSSSNWQNGSGSGLRVSFDDAENTANKVGIYIIYGKTNTFAPTPSETTTIAYSDNTDAWMGKTDIPVEINISNGKLTLTVNGTVIFNGVSLPADYLSADISNWVHSFSALTGGAGERAAIKDLTITSGSYQFGLSQTAGEPSTWQSGKLFDSLMPGTYTLWMRRDSVSACKSKIETITIVNTNPVVDLGGNYTICKGDSIVLDAGVPNATYVWSGTDNTNQTYTVTESGTYVVEVTVANGCKGFGSSTVNVNQAPQLTNSDLQMSTSGGSVVLTVINSAPFNSYNWDLGDGTTINDGPASITHIYDQAGIYDVTVDVVNSCGNSTLTKSIDFSSLGINKEEENTIAVYPNPSTNHFSIDLGNNNKARIVVTDLKGRTIKDLGNIQGVTKVNTSSWAAGVYLVHISNDKRTKVVRVVVE